MKKRVLVFVLLLSLIFSSITASFALDIEVDTLQKIEQEIEKTDYNLDVEELNEEQLNGHEAEVENKLDEIGFNNKAATEDFSRTNSEDIQSFMIEDIGTGERAILTQRLYINPEGEKLFIQIIYLPETNLLVHIQSSKISQDEKNIETFFEGTDLDNDGISSMQWPSFPSWLCWMGGTLGCGVYCGSIALVSKIAGVTCTVACGAMFHAACAGY